MYLLFFHVFLLPLTGLLIFLSHFYLRIISAHFLSEIFAALILHIIMLDHIIFYFSLLYNVFPDAFFGISGI